VVNKRDRFIVPGAAMVEYDVVGDVRLIAIDHRSPIQVDIVHDLVICPFIPEYQIVFDRDRRPMVVYCQCC